MRHEIFRGTDLDLLVRQLRRDLGEDAMIVDSSVLDRGGRHVYEIRAVRSGEVATLLERLGEEGDAAAARSGPGPRVVAVVGPAGAGKTSAVMKLALSEHAWGRTRVGLVTLDTFRIGAVEEMHAWAEVAGLPLEVAYAGPDVPGILERLRDREVILVDAPGRDPRGEGSWRTLLDAFAPAEVHLAVPAGLRPELMRAVLRRYAPCAPTHLLPSMTDLLEDGEPVARMVEFLGLPCRWLACGEAVPEGLVPARRHLLAARGMLPGTAAGAA
jgi:flagellar biosynthesis protein FlhF